MGKKRGRDSFVFLVINQTSFVNIESRPLFRIHGSYTSTTTGNDTSTNTSNDSDEGDQDTDIKTDSPTFTTIQTGNYLTMLTRPPPRKGTAARAWRTTPIREAVRATTWPWAQGRTASVTMLPRPRESRTRWWAPAAARARPR